MKSQIPNIREDVFEKNIHILFVYITNAEEQNSLKKTTQLFTAHKS